MSEADQHVTSNVRLVLALGASILFSCNALTGVNDLKVEEGAPGAGGTSGTGGGGTSGAPGGAAGAGTCEPGNKFCDGECVSIGDPDYGCTETECDPCSFENATATCVDFACQFEACEDSWLDCDTDLSCETPVDDENDCTDNVCGHPAKTLSAPCDQNGGTHCDGAGNCIGCAEHDVRCDGNQPQVCQAGGTWQNTSACGGAAPVCSEGICVGVSSVAAGAEFNCALLSDNTVRCWGNNGFGQLGNGEAGVSISRPVATLGYYATAIFAGDRHACAINNSELECWGANDHGQIGNQVFAEQQLGPIRVDGLTDVQDAALGGGFTCAYGTFMGVKGVYCWGAASEGQLGNANTTDTNAPTDPALLTSAVVLSLGAGNQHACAVLGDGNFQCWGSNASRQLGNPSAQSTEIVPVGVPLPNASLVSGGNGHTCALSSDGLYCWGSNESGQVGNGSQVATEPVRIAEASDGYESVSAGALHTCGTVGNTLLCWGRNDQGQLGIGNTVSKDTPVAVDGIFVKPGKVSAGKASFDGHTCAIATDGNVWCWGSNSAGQLGTGDTTPSTVPVPVKW